METIDELVRELNGLLKAKELPKEKATELIEEAKSKFKVKIKMLDFAFYNELTQLCAHDEKLKGVKEQKFEYAAEQRELQRKCDQFIELRKQFRVKKSSFFYEEKYLVFFYMGKTPIDKYFKELLAEYKI